MFTQCKIGVRMNQNLLESYMNQNLFDFIRNIYRNHYREWKDNLFYAYPEVGQQLIAVDD